MLSHRDRLPVTMLGIGAAVDFVTGAVPPAGRLVQAAGLEWAHRLMREPGRLWRRYARTNSRFLVLATRSCCASAAPRLPLREATGKGPRAPDSALAPRAPLAAVHGPRRRWQPPRQRHRPAAPAARATSLRTVA